MMAMKRRKFPRSANVFGILVSWLLEIFIDQREIILTPHELSVLLTPTKNVKITTEHLNKIQALRQAINYQSVEWWVS